MADNFKIDIEIDANDNTAAAAESAKKNIDSVMNKAKGSKSVEIPITAKDKASGVINGVLSKLKGSKAGQFILSAKDNASSVISAVLSKLKGSKVGQFILNARDNASNTISSVSSKLKSFGSTAWKATITAVNKAGSVISEVLSNLKSLTGKAWKVTISVASGVAKAVTTPIKAVTSALTSTAGLVLGTAGTAAAVYEPMKIAGNYQQTEMAFSTLLGGQDNATSFLSQAKDFAAQTPFDFEDVTTSAKMLSAYGFAQDQILPMLTTIGDTSSALGAGADGIDRISRAFGQMYAKGTAKAQELLQLNELGIPTSKILQEELGLTAEQVANIGNEGIESEKVLNALMTGMNKRYGGMMDAQSKTRLGILSNMKDVFKNDLMKNWGEGLWSGIDPILSKISTWIGDNQDQIEKWGEAWKEAGSKISSWVGDKITDTAGRVKTMLGSEEWQNADGLFGKAGVAWDKLVAEPFSEWWNGGGKEKVLGGASNIGEGLGDVASGILTGLFGSGDSDALSWGGQIAESFVSGFKDGFDGDAVWESVKTGFSGLLDKMGGLIEEHPVLSALLGLIAANRISGGAISDFLTWLGRGGSGGSGNSGGTGGLGGGSYSCNTMNVTANVVNVYGNSVNNGSKVGGLATSVVPTLASILAGVGVLEGIGWLINEGIGQLSGENSPEYQPAYSRETADQQILNGTADKSGITAESLSQPVYSTGSNTTETTTTTVGSKAAETTTTTVGSKAAETTTAGSNVGETVSNTKQRIASAVLSIGAHSVSPGGSLLANIADGIGFAGKLGLIDSQKAEGTKNTLNALTLGSGLAASALVGAGAGAAAGLGALGLGTAGATGLTGAAGTASFTGAGSVIGKSLLGLFGSAAVQWVTSKIAGAEDLDATGELETSASTLQSSGSKFASEGGFASKGIGSGLDADSKTDTLGSGSKDAGTELAETMLKSLGEGFEGIDAKTLKNSGIGESLMNSLGESLEGMDTKALKGTNIGENLMNTIGSSLEEMDTKALKGTNIGENLMNTIGSSLEEMDSKTLKGLDIGESLMNALGSSLEEMDSKTLKDLDIGESLMNTIGASLEEMDTDALGDLDIGASLMNAIGASLEEMDTDALGDLEIGASLMNAIGSSLEEMDADALGDLDIGASLMNAIGTSLEDMDMSEIDIGSKIMESISASLEEVDFGEIDIGSKIVEGISASMEGADFSEVLAPLQEQMETLNELECNPTITATVEGAELVNALNAEIERVTDKSVTISASVSGTDAVRELANAIAQVQSKSVTITANYVTNGAAPKAKGSSDFEGGLAMVNDQKGISDPRELISYGGKAWMYEGTDVIAPIPKHAKIFTASQTQKMLSNIPHYAEGKDNEGYGDMPYTIGESADKDSSGNTSTTTNGIQLSVNMNPTIEIQGGNNTEEKIAEVLKSRMKGIANDVAGEMANQLMRIFANMPTKGEVY